MTDGVRLCNRFDCIEFATKQAHFTIRPYGDRAEKAVGYLALFACDAHATAEEATRLITDPNGRAIVEEGFRRHGKAPPDWLRSTAEWLPIVGPAVRAEWLDS